MYGCKLVSIHDVDPVVMISSFTGGYCGAVPQIENGFVTNVSSVEFGGQVVYTCYPGFSITNEDRMPVLCQANKTWSQRPACVGK